MAGKVFPAVGLQTAGGRILPSPSEFYLTGEDRLRVVSCNALVGVSLKVQWRTVNTDGDIVPNSEDHTPTTDRTVKTQDFELGTGSLLNVTVFANAGAPRIGQTYVMVQLVRGIGAAAIVLGTLLGGCVTQTQALGFPGSPILNSTDAGFVTRTIRGTVPAAGVDFSETVPTGARWELMSVVARLTTSAVVASRGATLILADGIDVMAMCPHALAAPASSVRDYAWMQSMVNAVALVGLAGFQGVPTGLQLTAGQHFNAFTINIQAADTWTALVYTVKEWLEVG